MKYGRFMPFVLLPLLLALPAFTGHAQAVQDTLSDPAAGVEVTADRLEYLQDQKTLIGVGNVVASQGLDILKADRITVNTETQVARAFGHVVFERGGQIWQGDELVYNFATRQGEFGDFNTFLDPFYINAAESRRISDQEYELEDVTVTTCEGDNPGFFIRAASARLEGTRIRAKNVVMYLGGIPILFVPLYSLDLEKSNIDVLPGYASRLGAYLLTAYNYRLNPSLRAATHLDYRTLRGFGVGQDFIWAQPMEERLEPDQADWGGKLITYYAQDDKPYEDAEDEAEEAGLVDEERYRIKLQHRQSFSDRDYLRSEFQYLSDPDVLMDFFRQEYRRGAEPENRISLTHRGDYFVSGVQINKRLNDFYTSVDRLPEVFLDLPRQPIGLSPFYYEGQNSAAFLQKVYSEQEGRDDYEAFRLDSNHKIYWPTRHMGFLNVIPRAGYRATWYSETVETTTNSEFRAVSVDEVTAGVTNTLTVFTNVETVVMEEAGADLRNIFEVGFETSYKAFKVLEDPDAHNDGGLRHVAEPYLDYTYIPELDLEPDNLYQFDYIDRLDQRNDIRIGMRNKLQTKWAGDLHDLVDADVWTYYYLETEEDEDSIRAGYFDVEFDPVEWFSVAADGKIAISDTELNEINTRAKFTAADAFDSSLSVEYRHAEDRRNQVAAMIDLVPELRWSLGTYWRYDVDNSHMEEQGYYIRRKTDCLGMTLGYEGRGSDWDFWFQIWLTAMPDSAINVSGHY